MPFKLQCICLNFGINESSVRSGEMSITNLMSQKHLNSRIPLGRSIIRSEIGIHEYVVHIESLNSRAVTILGCQL